MTDISKTTVIPTREARLERALTRMAYETCLSPEEDDGSHLCKISREALYQAIAALSHPTDAPVICYRMVWAGIFGPPQVEVLGHRVRRMPEDHICPECGRSLDEEINPYA